MHRVLLGCQRIRVTLSITPNPHPSWHHPAGVRVDEDAYCFCKLIDQLRADALELTSDYFADESSIDFGDGALKACLKSININARCTSDCTRRSSVSLITVSGCSVVRRFRAPA